MFSNLNSRLLRLIAAYLLLAQICCAASLVTGNEVIDLLEGGDLSKWNLPRKNNSWTVVEGVLQRGEKRSGSISTKEKFKDFVLEFDWKIASKGNSGVIYRSQKGRGLEYQIFDDLGHKRGNDRLHSAASLYDLVGVKKDRNARPAGEWNAAKIVADGDRVEHWLNGEKVLQIDQSSDDWNQRYLKSKYTKHGFENFGRVASPIMIQDHGSQVWYRNFKIKKLPPKPLPPETPAKPAPPKDKGFSQTYQVTAPPESLKLDKFYTKYVSANGYPVVSSSKVNDYALKEAAYLTNLMLANRPDVRKAMIESGSRLIVMAHSEFTTDVPEHSHMKPKDFWDARARGLGGSKTDPVCSCGEENLLAYKGDPYHSENILIHEFAHNIHLRGMMRVDPSFDRRLKQAYQQAMKMGLWKGKYASVNKNEYFAEGVQSWFDNNRQPDHDHNHVDTRKELKEYDPGLAALCQEVFGDTQLVYTKPTTRLHGHMQGYDPKKAPTFRWPDRVKKAQQEIRKKALDRNRKAKASASRPIQEHPVPASELWLTYSGKKGAPGNGRHIVLIAAEQEYRSEQSMPMLARTLSQLHGFDCTVLFSVNEQGEVDPTLPAPFKDKNKRHNIPGLQHLQKADCLILLSRFMHLPKVQMKHFIDYFDSGKPLIALRTANHGFWGGLDYQKNGQRVSLREMLGGSFMGHHGGWHREATRGKIVKEHAEHPILKGVSDIFGTSDVYRCHNEKNPFPKDCTALVLGQPLINLKRDAPPNTNKEPLPVAWTKTWTGSTGKVARIFHFTMGSAVDFENEGVRRTTVNAAYWCLEMEGKINSDSSVAIIGEYKPLKAGFNYAKLGVKPRKPAFYK